MLFSRSLISSARMARSALSRRRLSAADEDAAAAAADDRMAAADERDAAAEDAAADREAAAASFSSCASRLCFQTSATTAAASRTITVAEMIKSLRDGPRRRRTKDVPQWGQKLPSVTDCTLHLRQTLVVAPAPCAGSSNCG